VRAAAPVTCVTPPDAARAYADRMKPTPEVTIVVVPRERFGMAQESLESIYRHTRVPFELVYVDGGAPAAQGRWLDAESQRLGFRLIRTPHFASPNEARNLGIAATRTAFVVFVDNDVVCTEGWLERMLECAHETGATAVTPLICEGWPLHTRVHQAGGHFTEDAARFLAAPHGERQIRDELYAQGLNRDAVDPPFVRGPTQLCEFHCLLVRREYFARAGQLDEGMLATREHVDFSIGLLQAGASLWFEPASVVTYVYPNRHRPMQWADWPYFLVRWSVDWQVRSLDRFMTKWGVDLAREDERRFAHRNLGWRHFEGLVRPRLKRVPLLARAPFARRVLAAAMSRTIRLGSRMLVAREDRKRANPAPERLAERVGT
jgi:GT2 family glycosyltransferase